ncbi:MAG: phosphomannomutase [Acidobacteriota bacterium]|nr:phosphomannomutase [Bryobacteraceae bacterium CoA2 C42]MCA2966604.1 phosphomannomutase [Acidobacteriaceae bacterium]
MTLRQSLLTPPVLLKFGTSGRRGEIIHLTPLEIYLNVRAELEFLLALSAPEGGICVGEEFYFACDLRPSSPALAAAAVEAIRDAGMVPVNCGCIPTPALMAYALSRGKASLMVTGSHIPFNRNGYKLNTSRGELLKHHEEPINAFVARWRDRLYQESAGDSRFDASGAFKTAPAPLPPESPEAAELYLERYTVFFAGKSLAGKRILVYQHSAVGRDLLVTLLQRLGAEVVPAGRSESFVPIDTENIEASQLAAIQALVDGPYDAVASTDGDSDRPLLLGVNSDGSLRFFGGDLLGMVVAEYLGAGAVVVPVSCNDAIDRGSLAAVLAPKTRIGSPFVIAGMEAALASGKQIVCGWEANGGFLLGSDLPGLRALATRDAFLPLLCALFAAGPGTLGELFDRLPARFSRAALLKEFPRPTSLKILDQLTPETIARFFTAEHGFGPLERIDRTDGVRMLFAGGDVAHVRPSGNADELRIYAVADSQARADAIAAAGVASDGILRRLERFVS